MLIVSLRRSARRRFGGWKRPAWTPAAVAALAVTSLLATALAFAVQSWAQQFTTPTRSALIFSLEPVFA